MEKSWRFGLAVVGASALLVGLTAQARPRPEIALLGVRVFTPVTQVVRQFGNPKMVTNTQVTITEFQGQQQGGAPSGGFGTGGEQGGLGAPPGAPGFGGPSGDFGGGQGQTRIENEIVYVYQGKGGSTYVFQFNKDGRVVQISAYGRRPDPRVKTSRGIGLGDPYSKIITAYGAPDEHAFNGDVYAVRYNKLGVAFQLEARTNRVTGIFVAAGIPTMGAGFTGLGAQGGSGGGPQAPGLGGGAPTAPGGPPGRGGRWGGGGGGSAASPQI
ncbi:MAG: hypothetical protein KatS3mg016_1042 [Fimbriimonadales bacterium]|nr:MAG: hypothetical protein KatS3mg016_1042 [Fimbriimonadales bacterium]